MSLCSIQHGELAYGIYQGEKYTKQYDSHSTGLEIYFMQWCLNASIILGFVSSKRYKAK